MRWSKKQQEDKSQPYFGSPRHTESGSPSKKRTYQSWSLTKKGLPKKSRSNSDTGVWNLPMSWIERSDTGNSATTATNVSGTMKRKNSEVFDDLEMDDDDSGDELIGTSSGGASTPTRAILRKSFDGSNSPALTGKEENQLVHTSVELPVMIDSEKRDLVEKRYSFSSQSGSLGSVSGGGGGGGSGAGLAKKLMGGNMARRLCSKTALRVYVALLLGIILLNQMFDNQEKVVRENSDLKLKLHEKEREIRAVTESKDQLANDLQTTNDNVAVVSERINSMEKELRTEMEADKSTYFERLKTMESKLLELITDNSALDLIRDKFYDTTTMHATLQENIEVHGQDRWVYPCDWNGCRMETQAQVFAHIIGSLEEDKRRGGNEKNKIRVVQLGTCSLDLLESSIQHFHERIQKFLIVDRLSAEGKSCQKFRSKDEIITSIHKMKEKHGVTADLDIDIQDTDFENNGLINSFDNKYFDALVCNTDANAGDFDQMLGKWFGKLRNDGVVFGHGYGVLYVNKNNSLQDIHASWASPNNITNMQLQNIKQGADKFFNSVKDKTNGRLRLAGDTVWYFYKKRMSISDVFN